MENSRRASGGLLVLWVRDWGSGGAGVIEGDRESGFNEPDMTAIDAV